MNKFCFALLSLSTLFVVFSCSQGQIWDPAKNEVQIQKDLDTNIFSVSSNIVSSEVNPSSILVVSSIKANSSTNINVSSNLNTSSNVNKSSTITVSSAVAPSSQSQGGCVLWTSGLWTYDGTKWNGPSCVKDDSNKEFTCNAGKENGCAADGPSGPFGSLYYTAK